MPTIPESLAIAVQHQQDGRLQAAEEIYRQILEIEPNQPEAHYNLGLTFKQQEKLEEAVACYRRAVELKPDFAAAHNNLGNVLREQGNLDEAAACCRRAIELSPVFAGAHNNLGVTLREQGELNEAIACWRRAIELNSDFAEAHSNLGNVLRDLAYLDDAVACFRRAVELKPDFAEAHSTLGSALAEAGDLEGAVESFRAAVRINSRFAFAHLKLAELRSGKVSDSELAAQHALLEEHDLPDAQRLLLHFSIARALDSRGEYAAAAEQLARGNALQVTERRRSGRDYDPIAYTSLVDRMISASTRDCFRRVRGFGMESELPVFVVGLPRSGTTLIEQIVANHSQVFGAGEIELVDDTVAGLGGERAEFIERLGDLDRTTAELLASQHLERLRALHPTALRIVDKMPENYFFLGLLANLFPRARLIHCRRDLRDVAVSCWMTHFRDIPWANDQDHIASRFHDYLRLMDHWRKVLPVPMLEVVYEETVEDVEGVAKRIVAWCGLEWELGCLDFHRSKRPVSSASLVQVRQPIFRSSVGRWKNYEQSLAPLFAGLK